MSSRHKLSEVLTKLSIMATCLQECISTMVELQSDSYNQQEDAHLGMRGSSLGSLTSRNIGNNNNKQEQEEEEEERSSLGELTPRTCKSKSEEGSHPELEQNKLEQEEAKQQQEHHRSSRSRTAYCTTKGSRTTKTTTTTITTTTTTKASGEAKAASKTQKMVQHMLEEEDTQQKLAGTTTRLVPAAKPAAPTSLDHTKPNAATDCSSFSEDN